MAKLLSREGLRRGPPVARAVSFLRTVCTTRSEFLHRKVIRDDGWGDEAMSREHDDEVARICVTLLQALPNLSQSELADAAGVHRSQISQYTSGEVVPRLKNRLRLARGAGVSPQLLAHIESFLSELLTAWKSGHGGELAAAPSPVASGGELGARAAEIVAREAGRARAELALLP
jgi:transcriptional regulator with XRE-family HTH domain